MSAESNPRIVWTHQGVSQKITSWRLFSKSLHVDIEDGRGFAFKDLTLDKVAYDLSGDSVVITLKTRCR